MRLRRATTPSRPRDTTIAFAVVSLAALVAGRVVPFHLFPSVCGFRNSTGLPCPSCGMTRAFVRVAHGDFGGALHVSPFGTGLSFVALGLVVWTLARLTVFKRGLVLDWTVREKQVAVGTAAVLLLANWVYLLVTGAATS